MRCIYKDEAGNRLYSDGRRYWARNAKGELMSRNGLNSMLREKGISLRGLGEEYRGTKRKK